MFELIDAPADAMAALGEGSRVRGPRGYFRGVPRGCLPCFSRTRPAAPCFPAGQRM